MSEKTATLALIKRNVKCYFKDKGLFITSLITPIILLFLYVTFLYDVYKTTYVEVLPPDFVYDEKLIDGMVGGLLLSSLLAVSTITVSFCANLAMVQDRVTGARQDFTVSPIKPRTLAIGYYISTAINALIIAFAATLLGCVYLAFSGWYLSFTDVLAFLLDVLLLTLFGTALSSLICYPLTSQGQLSAVGTIISAGYGFVCGAYMPLSQYGGALQKVLSFFPGTYGTSLLRNHALQGVYEEMQAQGFPSEALAEMRAVADCDPQFFSHTVEVWQMYLIIGLSIAVLLGAYILINYLSNRPKKAKNEK